MKLRKIIFLFVFAFSFANVSFADECELLPPCTGDPDEVEDGSGPIGVGQFYCCPNVTVPFDGGVSLLIAAGLGVGATGIYRKKKAQSK